MRFWWVNQNQTYNQEFDGGYLWSPKRKSNNARNPFYEFMREVSPGDAVLSFNKTRIPAMGIAQSYCYESPKPGEFGAVGDYWDGIGWKVDIQYFAMPSPIKPAAHMEILGPLLPEKYSPLQSNGVGLQGVYLTELSPELASALLGLMGHDARMIVRGNRISEHIRLDFDESLHSIWEDSLEESIKDNATIPETERQAIIVARRGQGRFKKNVQKLESRCRITGVDRLEHLIASHCKPWRDCATNKERLDGENGLLLTPSIDHLFDRGFISFESSGRLIVSPVAHKSSLHRMGIPDEQSTNVGKFSSGQKRYLDFHREFVFLAANIH